MVNLDELLNNIRKLRDKENGCEWDKKQTHDSLLQYVIEEAYELVDAIKNKSDNEVKDELGDLLLQVMLHSVIAEENGTYNIEDVITSLNKKIKRRHPHVFKNKKKLSMKELENQWESTKESENKDKRKHKDPFYSLPKHNSALIQTLKISKIASKLNFDWNNYKGPVKKVKEELKEVVTEKRKKNYNKNKVEEEVGDLLFSVVNLSRHLKVDPEIALITANTKFIKRFKLMLKEYKNINAFKRSSNKAKETKWIKIKKLK